MSFKEYKGLDLNKISKEILKIWSEKSIFKKSVISRENSENYIFYEGPPSANGIPGIHHMMGRTIKDIFCRYKTLQGFQVKRKAGWDTHGLPVELSVEKELGITKEAIGEKISVKDFNSACKVAVMKYTKTWKELTNKMGYWIDMDSPYVTYNSKYIETVWWLIKQLHLKDLLYKGYSIQPYSPKAGTGLSSHELNQPGTYKSVSDTSVTAQFKTIFSSLPEKLKKYNNLYLLAWTTTPWTLPSNTALSVNENINYCIIKTFNQYTFSPISVVIATKLIDKIFNKKFFKVKSLKELNTYNSNDKKIPFLFCQHIKGKDLIDIKYEKLWEDAPMPLHFPENAFRIISGNFVNIEEGTGIVHTAPTFGADDSKAAKEAVPEVPPLMVKDENNIPVPLVDLEGKFRKELGALGGKYVKNEYYETNKVPEKSVDVEIAIKLKENNKAFNVEKHIHSYPNCWRTDKPILYYPLDSWFIKVSSHNKKLSRQNSSINWKPKNTGEGRFGNWLLNANDWNLSRSRFWGIPLPIWRSKNKSETKVIGSIEELIIEINKSLEIGLMKKNPFSKFKIGDMQNSNYEKIDLHKENVDEIILTTSDGKPMYRESDLIDVWFDSGSMPFAQLHYPFENIEKIDGKINFPADFICEGVDQTRGWFYTLHVISTLLFDSVAYKNVISNGLVLDKKGQKMSKRLGNVIDPFETLEKYGPDATRWYMVNNSNPWDNLKFDFKGIEEVKRKFFGTLFNTYSFFSLYSNIDGWIYKEAPIPLKNRVETDQWILSELHSLIKTVDSAYQDFEPTKASRAISNFVQELLSNWYVRLSRRRFWKGAYGKDKISAYQTLFECLITISKLCSPIAPFYSDNLYLDLCSATNIENHESIHLSSFPKYNSEYINHYLEESMLKARIISSLVLSLRKKEQIKVRQPLNKILIPILNANEKKSILKVKELILSETNVKKIEFIDDESELLIKEIKPNFKSLGPKFGKDIKKIESLISKLTAQQIYDLENDKSITLKLNNKLISISKNDIEIKSKDINGWLVAKGNGITLALDIQITENLAYEGIARELINRIQNLRKDLGFKVTDKIIIYLKKNNILDPIIKKHENHIKAETLCEKIIIKENIDNGHNIAFEKIKTEILILKK